MGKMIAPLVVLGRLSRARENVKIAQREIDEAMRALLEREEVPDARAAGLPPTSLWFDDCLRKALRRAQQAVADLQTLVETIKPV